MTPNIDVIIPVRSSVEYQTVDLFHNCVEQVDRCTKNFRLIIVDDASNRQDAEVLNSIASYKPSSLYIRSYRQRWFTRTVNLGLRLVNTPWVVVLNSDAFVQEGWLEELFALTEFDPIRKVGLVGSVYSPHDPRRYIITNPPNFVTGHCWLLRMDAMHSVANARGTPNIFLDETTPKTIHIFSDNHLCYDMNRLGWLTVVSHHSHVEHEAGKSWGHLLHTIPNSLDAVNDRY